jgi:hypothetical protein
MALGVFKRSWLTTSKVSLHKALVLTSVYLGGLPRSRVKALTQPSF